MGAICDKTMSGDMTAILCDSLKRKAWNQGTGFSKEEMDDLRREFAPGRKYRCSDGMCGALDCERCHPGGEGEEGEPSAKEVYEEAVLAIRRFEATEAGMATMDAAKNAIANKPDDPVFLEQQVALLIPLIGELHRQVSRKLYWSEIEEAVATALKDKLE